MRQKVQCASPLLSLLILMIISFSIKMFFRRWKKKIFFHTQFSPPHDLVRPIAQSHAHAKNGDISATSKRKRKNKSDVKTLIPQIQEKGGGLMDMAFYFQRKAWQNEKKQKKSAFSRTDRQKSRRKRPNRSDADVKSMTHGVSHTHTRHEPHIIQADIYSPHTHTHITIKRRK